MIHTTMYIYPWDLIDEGVDRVTGFLKEEIGLDAVSLASVYHNCSAVRTHLQGREVVLSREDAIYFHPDLDLYRDTPIKPNVHPMIRSSDVWGDIRGLSQTRA